MRVWRLCRAKYAAAAFDGEGARLTGGRWSHRGTRVVYTAGSLSLAVLEMLVHFDHEDAPPDYVSIALDVPDDLGIETVALSDLPTQWRRMPAPEELQTLGSDWIERGASALLRVPSAVVDTEANFLVNPTHADFRRCRVGKPAPYRFDARLFPKRR
jgi:RES domain-containing protein